MSWQSLFEPHEGLQLDPSRQMTPPGHAVGEPVTHAWEPLHVLAGVSIPPLHEGPAQSLPELHWTQPRLALHAPMGGVQGKNAPAVQIELLHVLAAVYCDPLQLRQLPAQSCASPQPLPDGHVFPSASHSGPPQSLSVSSPFCAPSTQDTTSRGSSPRTGRGRSRR